MKHTTGVWNPKEKHLSFAAGADFIFPLIYKGILPDIKPKFKLNGLIELGSFNKNKAEQYFNYFDNLLVDSGAFSIASAYCKKHNIPLNQAFLTKYTSLDNYAKHWDKYIKVAQDYKDKYFGIVEIDLGGYQGKQEIRALIEQQGIIPIPVFHALVDPIEYFEQLVNEYDRVCISNIAFASKSDRVKIMLYINYYLYKQNLNTFIHWLGVGIVDSLFYNLLGSCDATTWLNGELYGKYTMWFYDYLAVYSKKFISIKGEDNQYYKSSAMAFLDYSSLDFNEIYKLSNYEY